MLCCWQGSDKFSTSKRARQGCGKTEELGWTCENVYVDFGEKTEQIHAGYKIALKLVRRDMKKKKKNERKIIKEEIKAMKSPLWPGSKCYCIVWVLTAICNVSPCLLSEDIRGTPYGGHTHKMDFFANVALLCHSLFPPCAFRWYVWGILEQAHYLCLLCRTLSPQEQTNTQVSFPKPLCFGLVSLAMSILVWELHT